MKEQRREFFRLEYPSRYRPEIISQDNSFDVLNVSEYGVKFKTDKVNGFDVGKQLAAQIRFNDDETIECNGEIIRLTESDVTVNLSTPIPLQKIRSQHLFLIQKLSLLYG